MPSNNKLTYRYALPTDALAIAALHTESWQISYAEILSPDYLSGPVVSERNQVWKSRFDQPNDNQIVWLCLDDNELAGFVCLYLEEDETWGSLLDNLHVSHRYQRQNIGQKLMQLAAREVANNKSSGHMYLWVLTENEKAINFYEKIEGINVGQSIHNFPPGHKSDVYRYHWNATKVGKLSAT